ncbi:hypothetical protein [Streptomyces sp. NPDC021212]|uniref:hypothetical protein n=1 Tax=Streptomyces sp. NPDC021212 TaxID=3365118 RepID=UPI0037968361
MGHTAESRRSRSSAVSPSDTPATASSNCSTVLTPTIGVAVGTVRAAAAGLRVADLDDYRVEDAAERALVLGYGNIGDTEIPAAIAPLREAPAGRPPDPPDRTRDTTVVTERFGRGPE